MTFPERFSNLPDYAFPRLRKLLDPFEFDGDAIHMSIGEPKHPFPDWVGEIIIKHQAEFGRYPINDGTPELLAAIASWYERRNGVQLDPTGQILALNGSREGLFNAVVALCPERIRGKPAKVLIPNPFYQAYAVGTAAVGAQPEYVNASAQTGYLPDFMGLSDETLAQTAIAFICSPSNPQGAVANEAYLRDLIGLAEKHDFRIIADECYSEIYTDTPPPSALAVAAQMGADVERVLVVNSLSKRSNVPGLRSGFAAGGPKTIRALKKLRNYAGAPLPMPLQRVAERLWADEEHVESNRTAYQEKFAMAREVFSHRQDIRIPEAGFFLWLPVQDDETTTVKLWRETGVRVLPGSYLARQTQDGNPGKQYIRAALVAPKQETQRGLECIRDCLFT